MAVIEKIRALHVIPNLLKGGAERFAIDACKALHRRDDTEVILATMSAESAYDNIAGELNRIDINSDYTPSITGKPTVNINGYRDILEEFDPHIIHSHLFRAELLTSQCLRSQSNYVVHCHDNMPQFQSFSLFVMGSKRKATDQFERQLLMKNKYKKVRTHFIANSQNTFDYFKRELPSAMADDVRVIPYGFDRKLFTPESDGRSYDKLRLINVGSFVAKKNQRLVIKIAEQLRSEGVPFEVTLLGDGPTKNELVDLVEERQLTDHINFKGIVDDVQKYLWSSNVYLHTANYEPFGLVFLEAMAAGLPCVTLNGKGNVDFMKHNVNAVVINEEDPTQFVKVLQRLLSDNNYREQLVGHGKQTALSYDIDVRIDELVKFYKEIINSNSNSG